MRAVAISQNPISHHTLNGPPSTHLAVTRYDKYRHRYNFNPATLKYLCSRSARQRSRSLAQRPTLPGVYNSRHGGFRRGCFVVPPEYLRKIGDSVKMYGGGRAESVNHVLHDFATAFATTFGESCRLGEQLLGAATFSFSTADGRVHPTANGRLSDIGYAILIHASS